MDLLDNNVLIGAFRSDLQYHASAKTWLEGALNSGSAVRLFPTVEVGFLRVVTHPKVFHPPSSIEEGSAFLRVLGEAPNVGIVPWTPACRDRWLTLCADRTLSGNDINDALLAAVAIEKKLRLVTFDLGFQRFPDLKLELLEG